VKPWTEQEDTTLRDMKARGAINEEIGAVLHKGRCAVSKRRVFLNATPEEQQTRRKKRAAYKRYERAVYSCRINAGPKPVEDPRASAEALAFRDARLLAPRTLTGWLCGDPPIGFSALDRLVSA